LYYELAVKNINLVLFKLGVKMISVVVEWHDNIYHEAQK
jgi:hypothetical protein